MRERACLFQRGKGERAEGAASEEGRDVGALFSARRVLPLK